MPLRITLFADFAAPGCYPTELAARRLAERGDAELVCRAYELSPPPGPLPPSLPDPPPELQALAEEEGIRLRSPGFPVRTRKAHEAARFAAERGVEGPMRAAIYRALWEEGRDVGRIDVLCHLIAGVGVEPEELKIALDIDRYREEVERDEEIAARLRVPGAPTLYLGTGPSARILLGAHGFRGLDEAIASR